MPAVAVVEICGGGAVGCGVIMELRQNSEAQNGTDFFPYICCLFNFIAQKTGFIAFTAWA